MNEYLTLAQVAERLQIPVSTLLHWRYTRLDFPSVRLGRHVRVSAPALEAWIEKQGRLEREGKS